MPMTLITGFFKLNSTMGTLQIDMKYDYLIIKYTVN